MALLAWVFGDPRVRQECAAALADSPTAAGSRCGLLRGRRERAGGRPALAAAACSSRGCRSALRRAASLHFMGLFATLFLPGSAGGDAVKIAWLAAEFPRRKIGGVLAALMDRLTGLVAIASVAPRDCRWRGRNGSSARRLPPRSFGACSSFSASACGGLLLWGIASRPRWRDRHPRWLPMREHIMEIAGIFDAFFAGGRRAAAAVALSCVALASFFLIYYCAARALAAPVSLLDMFSVMPVVDVITHAARDASPGSACARKLSRRCSARSAACRRARRC